MEPMTLILSFSDEYDFLSNMYPCTINSSGKTFPSSEHLYQWCKLETKDLNYPWWEEKIRTAVHGKVAKKLIRHEKCPTVKLDDVQKLQVMHHAVYLKFTQNPHLRSMLLETGNADMQEGNWWGDTFWGVCNGHGENHLGKILMSVRDTLREGE